MKSKRVLLLCFVFTMMVLSPAIAQAGSYWKTGHVTKSAWHDRYGYVEIDTIKYTLMPKVRVLVPSERKLYRGGLGRFQPSSYLNMGTEVTVKIEGRRIYEIILSE